MLSLPPGAHVHLIAVCGTAMGSLAAMLRQIGYRVTGSDAHVYPPMSEYLAAEGIAVQTGFDAARLDPAPDLVVVGNAVSRGNVEAEAVLERRIPYLCLPEVVRDLFLRQRRPVVITGTHGKTTTTALAAHLLSAAGRDPGFLVAGIPRDFPRPYQLGAGEHFVIEGDEYDSAFFAKHAKFLYYLPEVLVINNIEYDHADIYRDLSEIERAFRQVVNLVPATGLVLANGEDPVVTGVVSRSFAPVETFGLAPDCDLRGTDIDTRGRCQYFTVWRHAAELGRFELGLSGEYSVRNALAAIGVGLRAGLTATELGAGLASFRGMKRRQEELGRPGGVLLIDDFAHHPTAVAHTLEGLRRAHPTGRLWAVFEPASASNARDLFEARYVAAFAPADRVVIGAVPRPERSGGEPPFSPARLAEAVSRSGREAVHLAAADDIAGHVVAGVRSGDVVVFMSNAAFGGVQRKVLEALTARGDGA
ncbi:MAG: Mur ligase family protein [Gemmatimonadota bacterium]